MEITVHSVIDNLNDSELPDGEPEINIITLPCSIEASAGGARVSYREEGEGGAVDVSIEQLEDGAVMLRRRGAVEWDVAFREGETVRTLYRVPPYSFDATVYTKKIRISAEPNLVIQLIYSMDIGGQKKNVRMKITVKG